MKIFNFFLIFVLFSNLSANIFDDKEQARKTGDIVQIAVPLYAFGLLFYNDDFKDGFYLMLLVLLPLKEALKYLNV